jgi:hypothetical protein
MVNLLSEEEGYIYDVVERLALRLRDDELTDRHLGFYNKLMKLCHGRSKELTERMAGYQEFQDSLKNLKEKMKDMMREVVQDDKRFIEAVKVYWGESVGAHRRFLQPRPSGAKTRERTSVVCGLISHPYKIYCWYLCLMIRGKFRLLPQRHSIFHKYEGHGYCNRCHTSQD